MDLGSLKPEEMNLQFGDSPGKQGREDLSLTQCTEDGNVINWDTYNSFLTNLGGLAIP